MKTQHGRELTGEEMAQMLDEFVNGAYDKEVKEFVEAVVFRTHRTLQQKIFGLFLSLAEKYSTLNSSQYDLRNEQTVKVAKRICEAIDKYDRHMPLI